ncbi:ABC transporter ATP-binding protein [Candidatus Lokiarchaeum ossiferum]|uniref:ABC transporter ATP-binding protein n=1 Tax=Candidatus Lokiarchaeum ossiferum TaxID=2951803 RepID=UPI00352BFC88
MSAVITIKNLKKYYTKKFPKRVEIKAVDDISFEVNEGEIFGFLGPNGAGKTTTIRAILGMLRGVEGEITILGEKIDPNHQTTYRSKIGYIPGELGLEGDLTGLQMCEYLSKLYGNAFHLDEIQKIATRLNLDINRPTQELSKGNKQKVGILAALMGDFEILILDEPTSGLDPLIQAEFFKILKEKQRKTNCTVFLCSHILSEVEDNCQRVAIIREGKLVEISDITDLKEKGLKSFHLEFVTNASLKDFISYLQNEIPEASIKSQSTTTIEFLISPEKKRQLLHEVSGQEWAGEFVKDFNINSASLEEIFMKYYKTNDKENSEEMK